MNQGVQLTQFHRFKFDKNLETQQVKFTRKEVQKSSENT